MFRWVLALCALCLAPAAHADTVKIGVISTLSGSYARWGEQFRQAIAVYQRQNGTAVNGHTIEIISRDDEGPRPDVTRRIAQELIVNDKVQLLAGFPWSPNAGAIAALITETKTPTILFNAAASALTRQSRYFARTSFTLPQLAGPVGAWAAKNGIKTAITVVTDFAPGIDAETYFAKAFTTGGGRVLDKVRTPLNATDYFNVFERIRVLGGKPDAIFMSAPTGPASAGMIKAWASTLKPLGVKLLATNEITELYLADYGSDAIGIVSAVHYTENNNSELNKRLRADLVSQFGEKAIPDIATVAAYDGMRLIYQVVAKLGPRFNPDDVMKAIAGSSFDSPRGSKILIDPKERDIVQDVDIRRVEERGGKPFIVVIDTIPMVKDLWKEDNPEK
jgi:branched-chain amino acid transport system substrate-binding protein